MITHKGTRIIESDNFILRPFTMNDAIQMYHNWASDEEVTKFLTWEQHSDISKTKMVLTLWENAYNNNQFYNWAIEEKVSNYVIGSINLMNIDNINENCEVGFCIGKIFWNRGIMTEVLHSILDFAFNEVNFERITARRHINNIGSGMLLKKCNFIFEGTLRKIIKDNKGAFVDCSYYSILKTEYLKMRSCGYRYLENHIK